MSKVLDRASAVFKATDTVSAGEKLAAAVSAEHQRHSQAIRAEAAQYGSALTGIVDSAKIRAEEVTTAQLELAREQAQLDSVIASANAAQEDTAADLGG